MTTSQNIKLLLVSKRNLQIRDYFPMYDKSNFLESQLEIQSLEKFINGVKELDAVRDQKKAEEKQAKMEVNKMRNSLSR